MTEQIRPGSSPSINALPRPETPSLATVIDWITADPGLASGRRRNICSALRTMAKAAGGTPDRIPANPALLRQRTAAFHPEQAGFTLKRWRNVQSEVNFALKRVRLNSSGSGLPRIPLLPAWQVLRDATRDRGLYWGLWRLAGFCSAQGITPEAVSDAAIASFHQVLVEENLRKDPDDLVRRTIRHWNRALRQVPDWPAIELTLASRSRRFSLPLETFTAAFQADTATFLGRLAGHDLFSEDGPPRPLAAATLSSRHHQIRALASALVLSGIPRETIVGLADLVTPDRFRLAMEFMLRRNGSRTSTNIHDLATAAVVIAKHHVRVDAATLARLRQMTARLDPRLGGGLTEKNRRRLRQFNDQRNKALLLHLPRRLRAEAEARGAPDRKGAMLMQMAVAIELSLMCMLRRKNLVHLDAERHLRWSRAGREGVCHLGIEATEVKNGESLEFELPRETADLVKLYLERYQPLLVAMPCSWLFPGHGGKKPKDPRNFSDQITRCVLSRTGLEIHLHLFRHICAKLHLDAHPGSYEVLTRILGHRSANTLRAFYCGLEMMAAARHVDAGILAQRTATRPLLARRARHRSPRKAGR